MNLPERGGSRFKTGSDAMRDGVRGWDAANMDDVQGMCDLNGSEHACSTRRADERWAKSSAGDAPCYSALR